MAARAASPATKHLISHGRGGAANIQEDDNIYTDGGIVREGKEGDQGDGAFSAGRGGAANIGGVGTKHKPAADHDIIPETAIRDTRHHEIFHTGRGGEGNLHHETSQTDLKKHGHKTAEKSINTEAGEPEASLSDKSSNSKKRRSLFGRFGSSNGEAETDPARKAKKEEKAAKRAEHEKKHPPPFHGGLGDKLKYKVFGRVYD